MAAFREPSFRTEPVLFFRPGDPAEGVGEDLPRVPPETGYGHAPVGALRSGVLVSYVTPSGGGTVAGRPAPGRAGAPYRKLTIGSTATAG